MVSLWASGHFSGLLMNKSRPQIWVQNEVSGSADGILPSETGSAVFKRDGSTALAWHNSPVVDRTRLIHHNGADMRLIFGPHVLQKLRRLHPHCCWIKTNRLFMAPAKLRELICALPTHLFAEGGRGRMARTSETLPSEQLAWNKSKSNLKPKLREASWCGACCKLDISLWVHSVWAQRAQLQVSLCQLEKL